MGSTEPVRRSGRSAVQVASSRSAEILVQNEILDLAKAAGPTSNAGRPIGSADLKSRKRRGKCHTLSQLQNCPWYAVTTAHKGTLQELVVAYNRVPAYLQKTFRSAIAVQSRHRMESGSLDTTNRDHKRLLRTRQQEISEITGHDITGQVKNAIICGMISPDEVKEILDAIGTVLDKVGGKGLFELGFAYSKALTPDQAVQVKLETHLSDDDYKVLKHLLPEGSIPGMKAVKLAQFMKSPDVKKLEGVPDGAFLVDLVSNIEDDLAQLGAQMMGITLDNKRK